MTQLTKKDLLLNLEGIRQEVHRQHPHSPRLNDLDAHVATVAMVVEHVFDETQRALDEAKLTLKNPDWRRGGTA